ncbi:MAG: NAD(P)H-hydrate dehydratase, partial [Acidimicrobiales bacterium]
GEGQSHAGRVVVADIGLSVGEPSAHLVEDADMAWLPARPRTSHKWDRAVWVVAGSPGMRGASSLCVRAAQRAGAGMVRAGSPGVAASEHPAGEAVAVDLPSERWEKTVLGQLDRCKALVVGPGLGRAESVQAGVRALVGAAEVPVVVDADGLYALGEPDSLDGRVVLTPHDGEFARLRGAPADADRMQSVRDLAAATGAIVLLKGASTIVAAPDGTALLATSGDARLATAGTGDVLAGIIGAFLAAGVAPLEAAALAAHVHGRAAGLGHAVGLLAGDLPDLLPSVLALGQG